MSMTVTINHNMEYKIATYWSLKLLGLSAFKLQTQQQIVIWSFKVTKDSLLLNNFQNFEKHVLTNIYLFETSCFSKENFKYVMQ
jgi:hypothetical protein